nr:nucleic acid-binding, OB-fold protein [Tanacetum cinerariifolium]
HKKKTTLTEWLHYNEWITDGRYLTYLDFPYEFVWYADGEYWRRRRVRTKSSIGIRTVNEVVYPTCQAACEALGLLENDREWEIKLEEAAFTATPTDLRTLLAHILTFCQVFDPIKLWNRTWKSMSEDIPYNSSISLNIPNLHIDNSDLEDYVLFIVASKIEVVLREVFSSMETSSISKNTSEENGKMIITKPSVTIIADLKPMDTNKTIKAVVYRKWTSKHVQTQQPMKYCCILLDKQGTPIQASMDVKDTAYFDRLLQLHKAYTTSGFSCEQTGLWERTLDNPTSLIFERFIQLEEVPGEDFPEHYFNFASYNKPAARADVKNAILTYYIGRIQAVSKIHTSGDATSHTEYFNLIS